MAIPLRAVSGKVKSTKCKQPLIFLCDLSQISSPPEPSAAFAVVPTIQRKETPSRSLLFCTLTSLPTAPISDSYPYSASKQLSFFPPASAQSLQPTSRPASAQALPTSAQPHTNTIRRITPHSPQTPPRTPPFRSLQIPCPSASPRPHSRSQTALFEPEASSLARHDFSVLHGFSCSLRFLQRSF